MKCVGVQKWADLNKAYVRVVEGRPGQSITKIVHIVDDDRYFDIEEWAAKIQGKD